MGTPSKYSHPNWAEFDKVQNNLTNLLNPYSKNVNEIGTLPFYSSGARALIKVGGRPIAVCQSFQWTATYQPNPIVTIDTVVPWDIDVGPLTVTANLSQILDPTKGPEADTLFSIMSASVHQPLVELQVLDKLGTSLFFARGMFLSVTGNITKGQVSTLSAQFTGIAYQHYVEQQFKPYSGVAAGVSGLVNSLASLGSKFSGGIL